MPKSDSAYLVQLGDQVGGWTDVGLLGSSNNTNWFESFDSYWGLAERPILGQVFEDQGPGWKPSTHVALPRWFSHLLPEGILRRTAARAIGIHVDREFDLIAALGADDLPGAVRIVGADRPGTQHGFSSESEEARDFQDGPLKFSLAGLQMKFSVRNSDRGLTVPVSGAAGDVILKLPDSRPDFGGVPTAEYAAMTLAKRSGIAAAEVALVDAKRIAGLDEWTSKFTEPSLAVTRFDRVSAGRVHVEELAQVMNVPVARAEAKYRFTNFESVAVTLGELAGQYAVEQVIDRIVLNVLVGNGDAHLKNWAVVYDDSQTPALSPAYDIVPTVLYVSNDDLGLNLNKSKSFTAVTADSFKRLGELSRYGADEARDRAQLAAARVLEAWPVLGEILPSEQSVRLSERLATLPLAR